MRTSRDPAGRCGELFLGTFPEWQWSSIPTLDLVSFRLRGTFTDRTTCHSNRGTKRRRCYHFSNFPDRDCLLGRTGKITSGCAGSTRTSSQGSQKSLSVAPVDATVADALRTIPRDVVPDMPDRIIAATAVRLNAELVTRDRQLHAAGALRTAGLRIVW
jgi:hypothetical protein